MNNLFWGFFLIYIHFNLNLGSHTFELLPDFVGYMRIRDGAEELEGESIRFHDCRAVSRVLVIYSVIIWVADALGVRLGTLGIVAGLVALAARLYVGWLAVSGIREMEEHRGVDLNGQRLYSAWVAMAAIQVITSLLGLLGLDSGGLALLVLVMWFIALIVFLTGLWKAKKNYEALTLPEA